MARYMLIRSAAVLVAALGLSSVEVSASVADAVTIHVSPSGSDSASGTPSEPIKTLGTAHSKVRAALAAGSTPVAVELADGEYPLTQTLVMDQRDSGSSGAPVTWRAAAGAGLDFDQLFVNGVRQILARFPNYNPSLRLGGYDRNAIAASRVGRWSNPATAQVRGLHGSEWDGNSYVGTGRNPDGGLAMRWVGDNQRGNGLHGEFRMVENVFEELDAAGEWFYDKVSGKLYFWPPAGTDLGSATVALAELNELIRVQGSDPGNTAHDITFTRLTFTRTHRTLFNSTFEPISLSDWAIVRKAAVAIKNTARISVTASTFDQVGGNAIFMDGYGDANVVNDNVFTGAGASAVAIVGAERSARLASTWGREIRTMTDTTPGPATQDYPRGITVSDNLIRDLGVFEKQSAGVQIARAFRVSVSHNTIHDGPRAAINVGDGTFGGHRFNGNDLWRMVKETGDHGPINSWGRDRFWPINGASDAQRKMWSTLDHIEPTVIENNRIWHNSEWAINLDDGSSNYVLRNNLLLNSGTKFREGFNRSSTNNIYVNGGAHFHVSYGDNGDTVRSNIFLTGTPYHFIQADPGHSRISHNNNVFWNNGGGVGFSPYGNDLGAWRQSRGQDGNSIVADPKFTGPTPWTDPAKKDYTLQPDSPALARGFAQIPMTGFGRPGSAEVPPPAAGLRPGDVIQRHNDIWLTQKNSFWSLWNRTASGTPVQLALWRNQTATSVTLNRPGRVERINNTSGVSYDEPGWEWRDAAAGGAQNHLDDLDSSQNSGDSISLTFTGTRLKMITQTSSDETTIQISVDGGPSRRVSLSSPTRVHQVEVFDTGELAAGTHTPLDPAMNRQRPAPAKKVRNA